MYLYHSNDNHYDLLANDDSRLAVVDLLGDGENEPKNNPEAWKTVKSGKQSKKPNVAEERLLAEDELKQSPDNKDLDENEEELTLFKSKNSGHKRTAPQASAENKENTSSSFKCNKCAKELESQGFLDAHMSSHANSSFTCQECDLDFEKSLDLEMHKIEEHEVSKKSGEWNCNDCFHQSDNASDLMKHLKATGHQPSPNIQNKRMVFQDYRQCYTCRLEFDGYWNLMTHRKHIHPSNKKCRNFPSGKCNFGVDCWYVHEEELMEVDESFKADSKPEALVFKCYLCTIDFQTKNSFMKHKKERHPSAVQLCEKSDSNMCSRTNEECWFLHNSEKMQSPLKKKQVFHNVSGNQVPPEQIAKLMEMMSNLCTKVDAMDKRMNKEGM